MRREREEEGTHRIEISRNPLSECESRDNERAATRVKSSAKRGQETFSTACVSLSLSPRFPLALVHTPFPSCAGHD